MSARDDYTAEAYFERRIRAFGGPGFVLGGVTRNSSERKELIRRGILGVRLSEAIMGNFNGKPETFRQAFERHYGEKLEP